VATAPTLPDPGTTRPESGDVTIERGTLFGRYVIQDLLGAGGMGVVFAAHDGSLDRAVALKIVRDDATTRESQARLVREAKAMARVSHPAIVAVHDVGVVGARVFIAMELVRGTTLRAWLDAEPRPWRAIVRAFVEAGRGLEAAHLAGVIHRDFKPENVLVERDTGRIRVTDFGIADLLAGDEPTPPHSAGTPWYMAPEQFLHKPIDARADQFSFAVALWQAVYGDHPFAASEAELVTAVTGGRLRTPPRDVAPARWLVDVLGRALATAPVDRYASMTALLYELDRHTAPVRPRIVVPIVLGACALTISAVILWPRSVAGIACSDAGGSASKVWNMPRRTAVGVALPASTREATLSALDSYAQNWRTARVDACRATHERGEQSGELLDLRMQCLDRRLGELDSLATVLATPDPVVRAHAADAARALSSLASCADVVGLRDATPLPADPALRARVANTEHVLGEIKADLDTGRFARAFAASEPAVREATSIGFQPTLAEAELLHGSAAWRTDHMDVAEVALQHAIASSEVGHVGRTGARAWLELIWFVSQERRKPEEALRLAAIAEGTVARYADEPLMIAMLAERRGVTELDMGKLDLARPHLEQAYKLRRQQLGDRDPSVAASLQDLALLAAARDDWPTAIARHRDALAGFEAALGADHPSSLVERSNLASALFEADKLDEALALYRQGLAVVERTQDPDGLDATMYRHNIGLVLTMQGHHDDAIALQRRALAAYLRIRGADHQDVALQRLELARALRKAGRYAEAIAAYQTAIESIERAFGHDAPELEQARTGLEQARAPRPR